MDKRLWRPRCRISASWSALLKKSIFLIILAELSSPVGAVDLSMYLGYGAVNMDYINGQLEALAGREGVEFSPVRWVWDAQVIAWPLSNLGGGLRLFSAAGTVHGRVPERLTVTAMGIEACTRSHISVLRKPLTIEVGVGMYSASVSGVMSGTGLGIGGYVSGKVPILSFRGLLVNAVTVWRLLPFRSIRDDGRAIASGDRAAVDFSGFSIGLELLWGT